MKKNNTEASKEDESDEVNIIINNLPLEDEWNESKINFENIFGYKIDIKNTTIKI